jgi:hypothetical protein
MRKGAPTTDIQNDYFSKTQPKENRKSDEELMPEVV